MIQRYGYILLMFLMMGASAAMAQEPVTQVRVGTSVQNVKFQVDGVDYFATQTFFWTRGSKHIISLVPLQDARSAGSRYIFSGWVLGDGTTFSTNPTATVTADSTITSITRCTCSRVRTSWTTRKAKRMKRA